MIQRHSIALWKRAGSMSEDEMLFITYNVLKTLDEFGEELRPRYTEITGPNTGEIVELSYDYLKALLQKNTNKENGKVFYSLGRHMCFLSSFKEEKSCGIDLCIGVSSSRFSNTLTVDLPREGFSGLNERAHEFEDLVKNLIRVFDPYWGCVFNDKIFPEFDYRLWLGNKPITVHWMNYYNKATAEAIGLKEVLALPNLEILDNGYFFKLQDEPLDVDNPEHLRRQKEVSEQLGL